MDKYKARLNIRMIYIAVIIIAAAGVYICGFFGVFDKFMPSGDFGDFLRGFQTGVFVSHMIIFIYQIGRIIGALGDPDRLRQMYIEETDERRCVIAEKSGCNLFIAVCYPMLVAVLVSGYFSTTVFFTLLAALLFIELTHCVMRVYYKKSM